MGKVERRRGEVGGEAGARWASEGWEVYELGYRSSNGCNRKEYEERARRSSTRYWLSLQALADLLAGRIDVANSVLRGLCDALARRLQQGSASKLAFKGKWLLAADD